MAAMIIPAFMMLTLLWLILKLRNIGKRHPSLPPDPPTVPLLGNLNKFPTEFAHVKQYGNIYSLKIGPRTVIVLTSMQAVKELLEKRSASTVDRLSNFMADNITGGLNVAFAKYGEEWRVLRKATHAILTPKAAATHRAESIQMMYDFRKTPDHFYAHLRRYSNSAIMSVLWAPWKDMCEKTRNLQRDLYFGLLDECEGRMKEGEENGCYMEEIIKHREELGLDRELAAYLGGAMIEGGSDSTSSLLQSLCLLLVAFPGVQCKAQEMDRVVGDQRIPTIDDAARLPYIQALVKETHRMRPVVPLGVPHLNREAEQYGGFLIPKGSTIFVNLYIFENPEVFNPDRYINNEFGTKAGVDTSNFRTGIPFGCGRRICPGIHLTTNSLIIAAMNLVWAFKFERAVDSRSGQAILVSISEYQKGMLNSPKPFKYKITCRSSKREELIEREFHNAIHVFEKFEGNLSDDDKAWLKVIRSSL
ncbi:hypothetical protein GYMLUDRAFT_251450 [Collybiopsis luxurians FD-317 M1]|uniref:Cytochrome P450 n=1 Tax=Collybiopsis luxurians FD-317 M1 TaxID=944289 RepID=A0A0D0APJ6_9AGAR|nr:hypothetical protein GYMLUDRAFT_251450 [Collybiopsis luxurians FD-317 M1]